MGTPPTGVAALRALFETAEEAARREFGIQLVDGVVTRFDVPSGLIRGTLR